MSTERAQSWGAPVIGVLAGVVYFVIFMVWDELWMAVFGLAVMWIYSALLVFGSRRSETVALMRGEAKDERHRQINLRASSFTLNVMVVVMVGALLYELSRGHSGQPWTWLAAVFALAYGGSTAFYARRG